MNITNRKLLLPVFRNMKQSLRQNKGRLRDIPIAVWMLETADLVAEHEEYLPRGKGRLAAKGSRVPQLGIFLHQHKDPRIGMSR